MKRGGKMVRTYGLYLVLILCISFFLPRFLPGSPLSVLDEATASLDVDNETLVQESLSRLIRNKTVMIIAHRMRTVAEADKIVVLKDGVVAEQGTPAELEAKDGIYRHMKATQMEAAGWKW